MSRIFRANVIKLCMIPLVPIAGLLVLAGPAMADSGPVSVSANVPQSVSISGVAPAVSFDNAVAGQTDTVSGAESYTVASNAADGYRLTAQSAANMFAGSGSANIPNSAWTIHETGTQGISPTFHPSTTATNINITSGAGSDSYTEDWSLQVPASQAPGAYTNSLTYVVIGNP
jgi:hypothetical protein